MEHHITQHTIVAPAVERTPFDYTAGTIALVLIAAILVVLLKAVRASYRAEREHDAGLRYEMMSKGD
jgi:hypothetical protein